MGQDGIVVLFCALLTNYPRGTGPVAPLSRGPALHFRVEAAGGGKCRIVDEWGLEHACTFYACERAQPIGRSQHFWSACLGTQCIPLAQGLDPQTLRKATSGPRQSPSGSFMAILIQVPAVGFHLLPMTPDKAKCITVSSCDNCCLVCGLL